MIDAPDPQGFERTLDLVCRPLAQRARELHAALKRTVIIGLCGSQGAGKSTIASAAQKLLIADGLRAVALSIDDFYLDRPARAGLAQDVHPLLATRGPPGTHDVNLAHVILDQCSRSGGVRLPTFDKSADAPAPRATWTLVETPLDVVILEGWFVGAAPQPDELLISPVNELERKEDPDGAWRRFVNTRLADDYQPLFARLDALVLLRAPGFEVVAGWREEAEAKLRAATGKGMSAKEIGRFVAHYERLTRWILEEMPRRADWTVPLGLDRAPFP